MSVIPTSSFIHPIPLSPGPGVRPLTTSPIYLSPGPGVQPYTTIIPAPAPSPDTDPAVSVIGSSLVPAPSSDSASGWVSIGTAIPGDDGSISTESDGHRLAVPLAILFALLLVLGAALVSILLLRRRRRRNGAAAHEKCGATSARRCAHAHVHASAQVGGVSAPDARELKTEVDWTSLKSLQVDLEKYAEGRKASTPPSTDK